MEKKDVFDLPGDDNETEILEKRETKNKKNLEEEKLEMEKFQSYRTLKIRISTKKDGK